MNKIQREEKKRELVDRIMEIVERFYPRSDECCSDYYCPHDKIPSDIFYILQDYEFGVKKDNSFCNHARAYNKHINGRLCTVCVDCEERIDR